MIQAHMRCFVLVEVWLNGLI